MKKLLSLLVAAVFAVSSGFAVAASHTGAQPAKKDEMKKGDGKDGKKAKKSDKKAAKKDEAKK
jgi:hypothetical protein